MTKVIKIALIIILFVLPLSLCKPDGKKHALNLSYLISTKDSLSNLTEKASKDFKTDQERSLHYYILASDIARRIHDYKNLSLILNRIISINQELNNVEKLELYKQEQINVFKILISTQNDKEKIPTLMAIANDYVDMYSDSAIYYYDQVIQLSGQFGDDSVKAEAYLNIGYLYSHIGENTEALKYFQSALKIYSLKGNKGKIADCYQALSKINIYFGNNDIALQYEQKASKLYDNIKNNGGYYRALRHMGDIYLLKKDYSTSLALYDTAVNAASKNKDYDIVSSMYQSLGSFYWREKKYNKAIAYLTKGLHLRITHNEPVFRIINTYNGLGNVYRSMKQHKTSLIYYLKAYELSRKLRNYNIYSKALKNLGMTYAYLGNFSKSTSYLKESIKYAEIVGNYKSLLDSYNELQKLYEDLGNYKKSFEYFSKYSDLKDSLFSLENRNKISQFKSIYEIEKRAKEYESLKANNQQIYLVAFSIISLLTLIVLLVFFSKYKIKSKAIKILEGKNKQIAASTEMLEELNNNLKISESTYRYLFEKNPMPMIVWEVDSLNILAVNQAAEEHYGYSKEEFLRLKSSDLRADGTALKHNRHMDEKESELGRIDNLRHRKKNGTEIYVELITHSMDFEGRKALHVMIQDVTDRKLIEQAVMESEERYRNLFEGAPDAIILIDHKLGIIKDVNPAAVKLFQKSWPEMIGTQYLALFPTANINKIERFFSLISEKYSPSILETEVILPAGALLPVEISGILIRSSNYTVYQIIVRDITQRIMSERALHESEHKLLRTQKIAHVGNWEYDLNTKNIWLSEEAYNVMGIPEQKSYLPAENVISNFASDDRERIKQELKNTVRSGSEFEIKCRFVKSLTNEIRVIHAKAELIKNENGDPVKLLGAVRDITDIKKYQDDLIQAKEKAEQSDRLKSDFLAQMSHEIRSPINVILSYASLLRESLDETATEDIKVSFNAIDNSGRRLVRTIDSILNMADIQSGKYEINLEKTDLAKDIINNLILEFSSAASSKNLRLVFINEIGEKSISVDRYTVSQIFANLIDNAVKYTVQGEIVVRLREDESHVNVTIEDTGIGISEEYIPFLFDSFSQEERGYSRRFDGTGLGLSLVKKYCELNAAQINVESRKDFGSVFTVKFGIINQSLN